MMCLGCNESGSYEDLQRFCRCDMSFLRWKTVFGKNNKPVHHIVDTDPCRKEGCGCSWQTGKWKKDYENWKRKNK